MIGRSAAPAKRAIVPIFTGRRLPGGQRSGAIAPHAGLKEQSPSKLVSGTGLDTSQRPFDVKLASFFAKRRHVGYQVSEQPGDTLSSLALPWNAMCAASGPARSAAH